MKTDVAGHQGGFSRSRMPDIGGEENGLERGTPIQSLVDFSGELYDALVAYLRELLYSETLSEVEAGVTELALRSGLSALSRRQQDVFQRYVIDRHCNRRCRVCGIAIPYNEVWLHEERNGLCAYHDHVMNKED